MNFENLDTTKLYENMEINTEIDYEDLDIQVEGSKQIDVDDFIFYPGRITKWTYDCENEMEDQFEIALEEYLTKKGITEPTQKDIDDIDAGVFGEFYQEYLYDYCLESAIEDAEDNWESDNVEWYDDVDYVDED